MAFVTVAIATAVYVGAVLGQSGCSGGLRCVDIKACSSLLLLLKKPSRTPQDLERLRTSSCGYVGNNPQVCCPENSCLTPDGQSGSCVGLFACPHLLALLNGPKPLSAQVLDFSRRSSCAGPAAISVCCGPGPPTLPLEAAAESRVPPTAAPDEPVCTASARPPPPDSGCCGRDANNEVKITGGNETGLDQYPWTALIEFSRNNKISLLCGGALISSRYVITAAHCVAGSSSRFGTPVNVRLGEYDKSKAEDCVESAGGGQDCADPVLVLPIERVLPHPEYNSRSGRRNDIAVLRLGSDAPRTDFIRPICLPTADVTLAPPVNFSLWAAGWGAVSVDIPASDVKLHVQLPLFPPAACQLAYSAPIRNVPLWHKQLCAGGAEGRDTCAGDSGGPLMHENGPNYELLGVISFGTSYCGTEGVPGVYTKVYEYRDWIMSVTT